MKKNYRAELTGVFGDPVDGNPTGVMEEAGYEALNLNYRYITMQVRSEDLEAAFLGYDMAKDDLCFNPGEGFVEDDIEETIDNIGKIGRYGMKNTDKEILHLMLGHKDYICD